MTFPRITTVLVWTIALGVTAGVLCGRLLEQARPSIAAALHALALQLDGSLAYPDQPEPDPVMAVAQLKLQQEPTSAAPKPYPARRRSSKLPAKAA